MGGVHHYFLDLVPGDFVLVQPVLVHLVLVLHLVLDQVLVLDVLESSFDNSALCIHKCKGKV